MSENKDCKAAGDFGNGENIAHKDVTPCEKLKETNDKSLTVGNGNAQCLLDKIIQQESCPLIITKNNEEELAKVDSEIIKEEAINLKSSDVLKLEEEDNKKTEHEESCPLIANKSEDNSLKKGDNEDINSSVSKLQQEIKEKTKERDNYHNQLIEAEKKFETLEAAYNGFLNGKEDDSGLRQELKNLKILMAQSQSKLEDRTRVVANQENQINALMSQVSSLKDVVNITKDLLNIRNMEVKHLQENVDSMEEKINLEREKHNTMLIKMESAFKLNLDLKKEYETQLHLFQELREKYDRKVALLTEEKANLENADKKNKTI